jgi:hypothetical protein
MIEEMHGFKEMGCTRVFSTAQEKPADALYGLLTKEIKRTDSWVKVFKKILNNQPNNKNMVNI